MLETGIDPGRGGPGKSYSVMDHIGWGRGIIRGTGII